LGKRKGEVQSTGWRAGLCLVKAFAVAGGKKSNECQCCSGLVVDGVQKILPASKKCCLGEN
jgi:hypothetical protein